MTHSQHIGNATIMCGDVLESLRLLPDESVQCVVTSPPYWGLRDYQTAIWEGGNPDCDHVADPNATKRFGNPEFNVNRPSREETKTKGYYFGGTCGKCGALKIDVQIGLEPTLNEYLSKMVDVFSEVKRVLRKDGTVWLNMGDAYAGGGRGGQSEEKRSENWQPVYKPTGKLEGFKPKDLLMMPARLAIALQESGWWLRSEIIWAKPNPMPESVTDRPTSAHEKIYLLTKSAKYYYDYEAVKEESVSSGEVRDFGGKKGREYNPAPNDPNYRSGNEQWGRTFTTGPNRNLRNVWTIATQPYKEAHFAVFPEALPRKCIMAGTKEGDTVLDIFSGAATTGLVALKLNRKYIGIELNPEYVDMSLKRLAIEANQEKLF